ncbi:MAG: DNA polymerase I [Bdellovibrionales bacterium]|nr:DNA polymerase I [Bdellovibrionales bacterium]
MKLFLIDGSALAYRSYFAFITNPLKTSTGLNTSAIFGFTSTILRLLAKEKPDMIAAIADSREKTFRHDRFAEYKATREKMPEDLREQLPHIKEVMHAMNIPYISIPRYEADDVIGTFAKMASTQDIQTFIVSGDKDFIQLLGKNVFLYVIKKGSIEVLDARASEGKWGVKNHQVRDFMALMGDASDNIPGIPGVGEKTALKLIQQFGTLDAIYEHLSEIKPQKLQDKIAEYKEQVFMCKELVTIHTDVPLDFAIDDLKLKPFDEGQIKKLFTKFEFHALLKQISPQLNQEQTPTLDFTEFDTPELAHHFSEKILAFDKIALAKDEEGFALTADGLTGYVHNNNMSSMASVIENKKISKISVDIKSIWKILKHFGFTTNGELHDPMIQSYLLKPDGRHNTIAALIKNHLKVDVPDSSGIKGLCENSFFTWQLHEALYEKIVSSGMDKLYNNIEMPLTKVLAQMEITGIALDTKYLKSIETTIKTRLDQLTLDIHKTSGEEFNLNSPKQMGPVLFEKLKIQEVNKSKKIKKTKTGYSTDQETLEAYADHPIIKLILEYRNLSKLYSTYIVALPALVQEDTQRIHTSFNQTIAATGRLSSSEPNLQNIPIRTELGKNIRKAFIPGTKGWNIVSADYSQVELRILAHLSQDPTLVHTFKNDEDVHQKTASLIFNTPMDEVTPKIRNQAKAINFGIIYGMGPKRLSKETGISLKEAKAFIESYFEKYANIRTYLDSQVSHAKEYGYVETLLGRKRFIPDIHSSNPMLYSLAERVATNSPIQGSAADIIKIAMIRIFDELNNNKMQAKMLIQVHDELVFEAPETETETLVTMVKTQMEHSFELMVPLKVDVGIGKNWAEAH